MQVRRSDFAGSWYPGNESECRAEIEKLSGDLFPCPGGGEKRIGGIVPHAGWYFSGKVICNVIGCLRNETPPDTFVIFGRHLHPGSGNYIMKEGFWSTPLGEIRIDHEFADKLIKEFPFKIETASYNEPDNTIEVLLPFVKYFFPDVSILPVGLPPVNASLRIGERIAEISVEESRDVLILGSTDLTHYGYNYGFTPKGSGKQAVDWVKNENDKKIIDLMLAMDPEGIISESLVSYNACCSGAVASAVACMKKLGAVNGNKIAYTTSYDVRPDTSFVGYVGVIFS
ncbi:MAG: AmmeMemoRadiSam system protein B [Deltaproteobacteria bacterium]|nr:AmmeMemoRadiSam system protein B [Deltaproteobacteria bacterium]